MTHLANFTAKSLRCLLTLNVVPIGTTDNSNSFNQLQLIKVQVTGSPQLETSSLKAICEGDSSPICEQLPARGFVLNRTVSLMLLKAWKSLFPWLALLAVNGNKNQSQSQGFMFWKQETSILKMNLKSKGHLAEKHLDSLSV